MKDKNVLYRLLIRIKFYGMKLSFKDKIEIIFWVAAFAISIYSIRLVFDQLEISNQQTKAMIESLEEMKKQTNAVWATSGPCIYPAKPQLYYSNDGELLLQYTLLNTGNSVGVVDTVEFRYIVNNKLLIDPSYQCATYSFVPSQSIFINNVPLPYLPEKTPISNLKFSIKTIYSWIGLQNDSTSREIGMQCFEAIKENGRWDVKVTASNVFLKLKDSLTNH